MSWHPSPACLEIVRAAAIGDAGLMTDCLMRACHSAGSTAALKDELISNRLGPSIFCHLRGLDPASRTEALLLRLEREYVKQWETTQSMKPALAELASILGEAGHEFVLLKGPLFSQ